MTTATNPATWEHTLAAPSVDWRRAYHCALADGMSHQEATRYADNRADR